MSGKQYALGLDYGTNSVRCLIVDTDNGAEVGTAVYDFPHGEQGILLDPRDQNLARQHPQDYLDGARQTVREALTDAQKNDSQVSTEKIVGIGVDTTGSTPMPVDGSGVPLALDPKFADNLNAMAWLWKDHTSIEEAAEITEAARAYHPEYLAKCGGTYSSEWFFSKALHCIRTAPEIFDTAAGWVECCDVMVGLLTGNSNPKDLKASICAAGHKAMYHPDWGGVPERSFLTRLDAGLGVLHDNMYRKAGSIGERAGTLCEQWARELGLPIGIPVACSALDAHCGAVGSGVKQGTLAKILGTSSCDMTVAPLEVSLPDIPGLCGIAIESILPGHYGLEAGQSAVGDIYNWFVNSIRPESSHEQLTQAAALLKPGESGLLALDWNHGNRTVLVDPLLTGLLMGQTLRTTPAEIYRTLIEATAFGGLVIIERFLEYDVEIHEVVACGGIAEKNPMVMQIYADITNKTWKVSRSAQTCALGAAMAGAVVGGAHLSFAEANQAMVGFKDRVYEPIAEHSEIYRELYSLYMDLHDTLGTKDCSMNLFHIPKKLIELRNRVRNA